MNYQVQTTPSMGFVEAGKRYFNNATDFQGRARRSEYWMAVLYLMVVNMAFSFVTGLIAGLLGDVGAFIALAALFIWGLICLVASMSLCVRRLHDTGKSGWFYLLSLVPLGAIVLLVFFCMDSTEDNKWGPNPKIVKHTVPAENTAAQFAPPSLPPQPAAPEYDPTIYDPTPAPVAPPAPPVTPAPQMYGVLQMQSGPMAGKSFRVPAGRTVTVGRNPSVCELALSAYNVVSGTHCKIAFGNKTITIMDMNSTNGTFVNGIRLTPGKPVTVNDGATIQLANSTCTIRLRFE